MSASRTAALLALAAVLAVGARDGGPAQAQADASPSLEVIRVVPDPGPSWGALDVGAPPADLARVVRGEGLYGLRCASCHGSRGRGDGLFAADLPRQPRDFVAAPIRTRDREGPLSEDELFRSITVGAPALGMPSFGHLSDLDRWALAAFVRVLAGEEDAPAPALRLPPAPAIDLDLGKRTFVERCALCHGPSGDGQGAAGPSLVDTLGRPAPAANFTRGPSAFRGGARPQDIARTVLIGRGGTGMVPVELAPDALWSVATYVSRLAADGLAARRRGWERLFADRRAGARAPDQTVEAEKNPRWDPHLSASFIVAPDGRHGCTACHSGIAAIATGAMALSIDAFAGGHPDRACAVCHEGRPDAAHKAEAHEGMLGNPGSLWATSVGLGCGKCHSDRGALTSLHGRPLPEAVGGSLLAVRSKQTDPTGASGANHAYRMQRALMAQETGKIYAYTASTGLVERDAPRFTDFNVDDPDGPVPCAGSPTYRAAMARAYETGQVIRMPKGVSYPTFAEAYALTNNNEAAAAYNDVYRKECGRCHLWGEGRATPGEHRSSGCSACHVLTSRSGKSEGGDPTIPTDREGHPIRHRLEMAIPEEQCNHCHTRGAETMHTDDHQKAGIGCVDCHTSIDVHGDGNLYPSIVHQLEVTCEDCHGTTTRAPWELPLFDGTKAAGDRPRGVLGLDGKEHLVTSRGNARVNWLRRDGKAVLVSFLDGREHVVPMIRDKLVAAADVAPVSSLNPAAFAHAQPIPGHDKLTCAACHSSTGPSCTACHIDFFASGRSQDWLLSATDHDPLTLRQRPVFTTGAIEWREDGTSLGNPDMRDDRNGRMIPAIPGCTPDLRYVPSEDMKVRTFVPRMSPDRPGYPPPAGPSLPHERSVPARTCVACHVE